MLQLHRSTESLNTPLTKAKLAAKQRVIDVTDEIRRIYLTPITGQELTYDEKKAQAVAFLAADPTPTEAGTEYGFIFGEVGITANTPTEVAQIVVGMAGAFKTQIGPMIEHLRLLAGKNIKDATTIAEIDAAMTYFEENMNMLR